jgi:hypothetical protein
MMVVTCRTEAAYAMCVIQLPWKDNKAISNVRIHARMNWWLGLVGLSGKIQYADTTF